MPRKTRRAPTEWTRQRIQFEGFSQTLAKTALESIVEAHRAYPQLEEEVRLLGFQEKEAETNALTLMADGKEQSEVDQAMAEYFSIGDRIAISKRL